MSSSLFLQQYPACLTCEKGDRWLYSCCFVRCCILDLFKIAPYSCRLAFSPYFPSDSRWCIHVVVQILTQLGRNPVLFYQRNQIFIWSITYQQESMILLNVSWHRFLLMRYYCRGMWINRAMWINRGTWINRDMWTNFSSLSFTVMIHSSWLKHKNSVLFVFANASCCMIQTMPQGFGLGKGICENRQIIYIAGVCQSFCRISFASRLF